MSLKIPVIAMLAVLFGSAPGLADEKGQRVLAQVLDSDAFALVGAEVSARATVRMKGKVIRELNFSAKSRKYAPGLTKSLIRFTGPAELANVGFLQIQNANQDDDRFLFLPELKKSRRISGSTRSQAFMGTDFSYADLDRRDFRNAIATHKGTLKVGTHLCHHLEVTPRDADSPYAKIELWVRTDNLVPLKTLMFNRSGLLMKTLLSQELKRINGRWFITKSTMHNHPEERSSELVLEHIAPSDTIPDSDFTVRVLEKA